MGEPLKPPQEPDKPTASRIFVGFVLTLIGIPVLFVATCVPIGLVSMRGNMYTESSASAVVVGAYTVLFIGLFVWLAVRAKNAGVRWGIVTALIAGALWVGHLLFGLGLH